MTQAEIDTFVTNFLARHRLGVSGKGGVHFDTDTEPLVRESRVLDGMLAMAKREGSSTRLFFPDILRGDRLRQLLGANPEEFNGLQCIGGPIRVLERRVLYQPLFLFNFRLASVSDERSETIRPVLMDPMTEKPVGPMDIDDAAPWPAALLPNGRRSKPARPKNALTRLLSLEETLVQRDDRFKGRGYPTLRLYKAACRHLTAEIDSDLRRYEAAAEKRLAVDLRLLDDYYRGLREESIAPLRKLFRRLAAASVRTQFGGTSTGIERLKNQADAAEREFIESASKFDREKEKRVTELRDKYRSHVEITLISVAELRVPRLEMTLRLPGKAQREHVVYYDILQDGFTGWDCESCGKGLEQAFICEEGDISCATCYGTCADCGAGRCRTCTEAVCHLCGRLLCPGCEADCPLSTDVMTGVSVCDTCRERWCGTCARLTGLGVGD